MSYSKLEILTALSEYLQHAKWLIEFQYGYGTGAGEILALIETLSLNDETLHNKLNEFYESIKATPL